MTLDTTTSELCRTLYKLSHWEQPSGYTPPDTSGDEHWPAYTTDYLLEKIPQFLILDGRNCRLEVSPGGYGKVYKTPNYIPRRKFVAIWCAVYTDVKGAIPVLGTSDTPRKALLRLAISLHEQGLLKAEDKA